jgi:hypothetical protein
MHALFNGIYTSTYGFHMKKNAWIPYADCLGA